MCACAFKQTVVLIIKLKVADQYTNHLFSPIMISETNLKIRLAKTNFLIPLLVYCSLVDHNHIYSMKPDRNELILTRMPSHEKIHSSNSRILVLRLSFDDWLSSPSLMDEMLAQNLFRFGFLEFDN